MKLPMSIDEITACWVEKALSAQWPGLAVRSICVDRFVHGAATKARIRMDHTWTGADGPPASIWLKTGFEPHHDIVMPVYEIETRFYQNIRDRLPIRSPACYFAEIQHLPAQATLLLEDLSHQDTTFCVSTRPMTVEQAASGLQQLALLHSQALSVQPLNEVRPITRVRDSTALIVGDAATYFKKLRAYAAPRVLQDVSRTQAGFNAYWEMVFCHRPSLLHGDAHMGNCYIDSAGLVSFLDWQGFGTGYWMHDVPYFLIGALDLPDRRAAERDLLHYYLQQRASYGTPMPELAQVWDDYRRAIVHPFIIWLGNEDVWQPPEVNLSQFARFSAAMIDHDVYRALGV